MKLKHQFAVSLEAMAFRLESLGLLKQEPGSFNRKRVSASGRRRSHLGLVVETKPEPARLTATGSRRARLRRGELSEKELANYLPCDIWEARRVIQESMLSIEVDAEGYLHPMQADFEASLLADHALEKRTGA